MALSTIQNNSFADTAVHGYRNLVGNGAFTIAQRSTSETGISTSGYYTVDRWLYNNDEAAVVTMSQDTNAPDGFGYSFKTLVTTADTSIGASNQNRVETAWEGQDVQNLKYGTSDAQQLTVSFWVKSNKTGNWSVGLYMDGSAYNISQAYTINSADTWEYKTITFAANTVQTITNDNIKRLRLWFTLSAGSNLTSGSSNTWSTAGTTRAVGQAVNLFDAVNNYWQITGVQLEVGSEATPFEHRSYGDELRRCQRYFSVPVDDVDEDGVSNAVSAIGVGRGGGSGLIVVWALICPVPMRDRPALATSGEYWITDSNSRTQATPTSAIISQFSVNSTILLANYGFGSVVCDDDRVNMVGARTAVRITLDAEL